MKMFILLASIIVSFSAYTGIETGSGTISKSTFNKRSAHALYYLSLSELKKYLPITSITTNTGKMITKDKMPETYPLEKIYYLEMEDGQILYADEILELLQNDHQNLSSI